MSKILEGEKILKCGCAGATTHNRAHDGLEAGHKSCIIHETCEMVEAPSFEGRTARCMYFGKEVYKNECGECRGICTHEVPSKLNLAFFESRPDKEYDGFYCGCHSWD